MSDKSSVILLPASTSGPSSSLRPSGSERADDVHVTRASAQEYGYPSDGGYASELSYASEDEDRAPPHVFDTDARREGASSPSPPPPAPAKDRPVVSVMDLPEWPWDAVSAARRAASSAAYRSASEITSTDVSVWHRRVADVPKRSLQETMSGVTYRSSADETVWKDSGVARAFDKLAKRWKACVRTGKHDCQSGMANLRNDLDAIFVNAQTILTNVNRLRSEYAGRCDSIASQELREKAMLAIASRVHAVMDELRTAVVQAVRSSVDSHLSWQEGKDSSSSRWGDDTGTDASVQADMEELRAAVEAASETPDDVRRTLKTIADQRDRVVHGELNEIVRDMETRVE